MNRKEFLAKSLKMSLCCGALINLKESIAHPAPAQQPAQSDLEFMANWLTDLLDTIEAEVDPETRAKLMAGCGRGCFRRHQFKRNIASTGKGDIGKLIEAYSENFNVWREGDKVHIQYGTVSPHCYCPVVRNRLPKPNDMHCDCTRATHQSIFEEALQRPVKVEIIETLRRHGKTCHFVAHV